MTPKSNQSDVACILNLIEVEHRAAQRGLTGFVASATHAAIRRRMEQIGRLHEDLRAIVGNDAIRLVAERLETLSEEKMK